MSNGPGNDSCRRRERRYWRDWLAVAGPGTTTMRQPLPTRLPRPPHGPRRPRPPIRLPHRPRRSRWRRCRTTGRYQRTTHWSGGRQGWRLSGIQSYSLPDTGLLHRPASIWTSLPVRSAGSIEVSTKIMNASSASEATKLWTRCHTEVINSRSSKVTLTRNR